MTYTVAYIVGSISKNSLNRRLSQALITRAPQNLTFTEVTIADLPLYNPDHDAHFLPLAAEKKAVIEASDALMIVTPEYNRSIPGVLKNAIDWFSRPWGHGSLGGKPTLVAGASVGPMGAAFAQDDLKKILTFFNAHLLGQPELYINLTGDDFADDGHILREGTDAFLAGAMQTFAAHIEATLR
ncbi:NADPH-dependent FMN reductase [Schaalia sp. lx-100]|uniref:NADPH-dependent FMN reductase n=1 Tax=Schaalia sp. lx-100 TaxID=2899081 RepID=UPI001E62516C|nr:NADPH-dependent FMN reductase [Schaalia sp. lx-100]MCD4557528.1 NAD(P)H-dependent oxidoreductase [Schaalia sp. lx-100]